MKKFVFSLIAFISAIPVIAQVVINLPMVATDNLSQSRYTDINNNNLKITSATISNSVPVGAFTSVIKYQNYELRYISFPILAQQIGIRNFVSSASFNSVNGYNSYGYIQEKYPIVNLFSPSDIIKNNVIRLRFHKKLHFEDQRIHDYFNPLNPIPEGERILLILTSLENVINLVLENEEY